MITIVAVFVMLVIPTRDGLLMAILAVGGRIAYKHVKKANERAAHQRAANQPTPKDALRLGEDWHGLPVFLTDRQLAAHGLILGATGSGKTTSLLAMLCDEIVRGAPVVAIDLKGSPQFIEQLQTASSYAGRPFQCWTPDGPACWNPLAHGNATELKDKLISAEQFSEPHYQRAAERYLQTAIQVLHAARPDQEVTLRAVVDVLEPNNLKSLLPRVSKELMMRVGPYLTGLTRDQQSAIRGLESRLALISESTVGPYLEPDARAIDLRRALTGGTEVVCFSLNSSRYGKLSAQLAAMVIQDLIAVAGHRLAESHRPLALIAIDEFSALDADNILGLLARAREAGISTLLSTQEMADLERLAEGFRDQVLGNTAILLAHRQNVPDSAELVAKMIGTAPAWQRTYQTDARPRILSRPGAHATGLGTAKLVEEFRIHPNVIKELRSGQAVLLTKAPQTTATTVNVRPWNQAR
jgi:conjugal transfer pilus assembly protein TraD